MIDFKKALRAKPEDRERQRKALEDFKEKHIEERKRTLHSTKLFVLAI